MIKSYLQEVGINAEGILLVFVLSVGYFIRRKVCCFLILFIFLAVFLGIVKLGGGKFVCKFGIVEGKLRKMKINFKKM